MAVATLLGVPPGIRPDVRKNEKPQTRLFFHPLPNGTDPLAQVPNDLPPPKRENWVC